MDTQEAGFIFYVYAVTSIDNNVQYPEQGIDGEHLVECISVGGIQALVSKVSRTVFSRDSLVQKMADPIWLEKAVRIHTAIVNAIHSDRGIVPMRFLTLCKNKEEVERFLQQNASDIECALNSVSGCSEWGVKVYCDNQKLERQVLEQDEHIQLLEKQIAELKAGTSFLMKKRKARLAQEALARICNQRIDECHSHLVAFASGVEQVALQKGSIADRANSMVLNNAYLVDDRRSDDFEKMVGWLNQQFGEQGFEVSLSGPWPPYHFVNRVSNTIN